MKKICNDFNAAEWFDQENGVYVKIRDGQTVGRLRIEDLTNPDVLWDTKCGNAGVKKGTITAFLGGKAVRLKPSNAIYELWKYKEGA